MLPVEERVCGMWLRGVPLAEAARRTGLPLERIEVLYAAEVANATAFASSDRLVERVRLLRESQGRARSHRRAMRHFKNQKQFDLMQGALSMMRAESALQAKLLDSLESRRAEDAGDVARERGRALSEQLQEIRDVAAGHKSRAALGLSQYQDSLLHALRDGFDLGEEDNGGGEGAE